MNVNSKNKYQDFYGRNFLITSDVLIPRPETEQLIDMVLSLAGKSYLPGVKPTKRILPKQLKILDVGTGSGCIAITLKKELKDAEISAVDISEKALKVARKNAEIHDVHISFIISYLLERVNDKTLSTPNLVVANLPYVDPNWQWLNKESLSKEPSIALYADDHGLKLIKKLIDQASILNIRHLILEADPCQHETIIAYAKKAGFSYRETRGFIIYFSE